MWLKRSTSIFIKVAVVAILASGQDLVTLDENNTGPVTVPLGSPLTLKCNLTTPKQNIKWMNWHFNSSGPSRNSTLLNKTPQKVENDTEDLDFMFQVTSNAREENSGWYFCCATIEIPTLKIVKSSERHVLITKAMEHATHSSLPIVTSTQVRMSPPDSCQGMDCKHWAILGVLGFILLVLPVVLFVRRNRFHRSTGDDPIYANTRSVANKQPSPRPGMQLQSLKMASSQNLQDLTAGGRYEDGKRRIKH